MPAANYLNNIESNEYPQNYQEPQNYQAELEQKKEKEYYQFMVDRERKLASKVEAL